MSDMNSILDPVAAVGNPRFRRVFQGPVGAFFASTGPAASTGEPVSRPDLGRAK